MSNMLAKHFHGVNKLNDNLRIKRIWWYPPAIWGQCFVLQRRGFLGLWWTKSWIYVDVIKDSPVGYIEEWLRWEAGL